MTTPMSTLQGWWHTNLAQALMLQPESFQLSLPVVPMPASDAGLWNAYMNVIPPASTTFNHSHCQPDAFFDEYAAVVNQLVFPMTMLEQVIGPKCYAEWATWLSENYPSAPLNELPTLFRNWAMGSMDCSQYATQGASTLSQIALMTQMQAALKPYLPPDAKTPGFMPTYEQLEHALAISQGTHISLQRLTTGDAGTGAKAGCGVEGLWAGSCSTSRLSTTFAASTITIECAFEHLLQHASTPNNAWYNSSLLATAYRSQTKPPWPPEPNPTWDEAFGPYGSFKRCVASVVAVDGVQASIASDACFREADQQILKENAAQGLWPFYAPTGGAVANSVSFDREGCLTIFITIKTDNPSMLGTNVLSINQFLGGT